MRKQDEHFTQSASDENPTKSAFTQPASDKNSTKCQNDEYFMKCALEEAQKAYAIGEVPVGAVIVREGKIIARGYNRRELDKNALSHAELTAIGAACRELGGWRLPKCTLYVTLEPCPMCAGAIVNSRIERIVCGTRDSKAGAFGSVLNLNFYPLNHKPRVEYGVLERECSDILRKFFSELRIRQKNRGKKA